jgi:hypothetical protein
MREAQVNGSAAKFINRAGTGLTAPARRALKRLWLACPHREKPHLRRQIMVAARERAEEFARKAAEALTVEAMAK